MLLCCLTDRGSPSFENLPKDVGDLEHGILCLQTKWSPTKQCTYKLTILIHMLGTMDLTQYGGPTYTLQMLLEESSSQVHALESFLKAWFWLCTPGFGCVCFPQTRCDHKTLLVASKKLRVQRPASHYGPLRSVFLKL